jgi:short-subunit dehydrogenase
MKIAITGHKKGIGHAFAQQLQQRGHEIIGISRSDGENIRRVPHTASLIEPCDLLINNAISLYAQTELLFEVWHRWKDSENRHWIWNISTQLCENDRDVHLPGLTLRESMQYRNQKMALELAHKQLNDQPSKIEMTLIRPGSVKTQTFSADDAISADEYVASVLEQYADTLE